MKVIGIGLNKTGTKTLGACLLHWGFRHQSCSTRDFDLWRTGREDEVFVRMEKYDSFDDWPWPLMYKTIDSRFSGAKFILTRRKDVATWFESLCLHAERMGSSAFRQCIYGHDMPRNHRVEHVAFYEKHLADVRAYFHARPNDLLEVCWEEGDDWKKLAQFLGLPVPDRPFPHNNKRDSKAASPVLWQNRS